MAPEMTHGDATLVSPRTDVYLLGATLYHALTGRVPHDGESLFQIMYRAHESETLPLPGVHEELESIVQRAMAKAPEDRFCDVEELRQAVLDFQRHRSSIALADEARTSLDELQHLVGAGDDGREHEAAIRNLFGECRFGFHQALRLWPENPDATDGLKTALATMIRFEISVENPGAAGALLNELDADHPKLQRRVEELEAELAERERRYRELERFQKESDLNPGARARALAAIAAAILWTIFPLFAGAVLDAGWLELTPYYYFLHGFFFSGSLLVIVWIIRDRAFRNRANRALMRLVLGVAAVVPVYRFLTWQVELDPLVGVSFECMIYAVAFIALGIMSNRFAWFGGAAFSLAGILGIQFPDYLFEVFAAANFSALVWLYYIWRPSPEDPSEREDGG
jgi:serine/threonine-protein kinase